MYGEAGGSWDNGALKLRRSFLDRKLQGSRGDWQKNGPGEHVDGERTKHPRPHFSLFLSFLNTRENHPLQVLTKFTLSANKESFKIFAILRLLIWIEKILDEKAMYTWHTTPRLIAAAYNPN